MKMKTKSDIVFDIINYSLLTLIFFIAFYPLYFVVIASFSDPNYVNSGQTLLFPKGITLMAIKERLSSSRYGQVIKIVPFTHF